MQLRILILRFVAVFIIPDVSREDTAVVFNDQEGGQKIFIVGVTKEFTSRTLRNCGGRFLRNVERQ